MGIALGLFTAIVFQNQIVAQDTARVLHEVWISDSRVDAKTPLTSTNMDCMEIEKNKGDISLPYIVELQPSVVSSGENGKMGNTSLRIRGVDATRINVNINGITLNDAEDQSVFWVNFPNLAGMAQNIQIQRGIGASTGGSAAFGGAINLSTLTSKEKPYGSSEMSVGSWNTRQYGIMAGTGIGKRGFSFDMAYNGLTSDGFVRNGFCDHQSLFLNGSWYGAKSQLKAIAIIGKQRTGITWDGAYDYQLDADPTYNEAGAYYDQVGNVFYYSNESDNYNQQLYNIFYSRSLSEHWAINGAFNFTHGEGYYENYKNDTRASKYGLMLNGNPNQKSDFIVRKELDNDAYTGKLSANYSKNKVTFSFGEAILHYSGDHFGNVIWCQDSADFTADNPYQWYFNNGLKMDATSFLKANYDISESFNLYGDLQYRFINYKMEGVDDDFTPMHFDEDYHFFNPKAGANWRFADKQRTYFVCGISNREPARADIKEILKLSGDTIKAEEMLDIELGYQIADQNYSFSANAYAMLYKDQLTASGNLNDNGYALMENVDKSYRLGMELAGGYQFCKWFNMDANLTLSTNKILDYTFTDFISGIDTGLTTITANTDLSFSPSVVGAAIATIKPLKDGEFQLVGKYVGDMYCDNTSRLEAKQESYFIVNLKASYTWHLREGKSIEAQLTVNNILNKSYRISAWIADYEYDGIYYTDRAYYQQPGINYTARVAFKF